MDGFRTFKKIWNIFTFVLIGVVVLLAIALGGIRLIGLQPYTVLSGSMEPEYPVGSLIYVKKVDCTKLKEGDVITFMLNDDTVATHRIIEVLPDETDPSVVRFFTKGDANDNADSTSIHSNNVIGTPVFKIPYLGYVADYIRNPPGTYVAIACGALLILFAFLPDLLAPSEPKKDSSEPKKDSSEPNEGADSPTA